MPSSSSSDWRTFRAQQSGESLGQCECCGHTTRQVWGFVSQADETVAAYFISWTRDKPDHGAAFDLILGPWGDTARPEERYATTLDFRIADATPQFMVVDAGNRPVARSPLVGKALKRSDIIGTTLAAEVFSVVDAVYMSQSAAEIRAWSES